MGYQWSRHRLSICLGDEGPMVAFEPHMRDGRHVAWFSGPGRERVYEVFRVERDDAARFQFHDSAGRRLELQPMTLALWRRWMRPITRRDFDSLTTLRRRLLAEMEAG